MSKELKLVRRESARPAFSFSTAQHAVIAHSKSPLVIYGGPGTGKTTTLIESVISRVAAGVDPNSILILTYGRQSASSLRDAIALRAGSTSFEPLARTFHALAFSILNEKLSAENARYVLISGAEQDAAIAEMLQSPYVEIPWHNELSEATKTRGFVREVRDLILRATELGLTATDLRSWGTKLNEKYWEGAAHFWSSYFGANELKSATVGERLIRIDPSAIIVEAIDLLQSDANRLDYFRRRFTSILIDEFQESDPAQRKLLQLLAPEDLVIFADPDSAVGRFRGADPDGLVEALAALAPDHMTLDQNFRAPADISLVLKEVALSFRRGSPARLIRRELKSDTEKKKINTREVDVAKLRSRSESSQYIASVLRAAHLQEGIPWSKMAVILRSPGADVSAIARAFAQNSIPVEIDSAALALADNPAVKPLLLLAAIALRTEPLTVADWPMLEELLLSEYGGTDALQLRQIRLAFAKVRIDLLSTTEMMIDALINPSALLPWDQITPLKRINDLISVGRGALAKSSDVSDLLWAIWQSAVNYEGTKIPYLWRERALAGGARGAQADRDLDAVIALFESARRFTERNAGATPDLFIDQLKNERILGDAITTSAQREEVVTVTTVHSAKGLEWDLVVVTGLQDGIWPNLKARGSLLGSERLVEAFRTGLTSRAEISAMAASGLLDDERRLLYVALSRAKSRLLITAFAEEDSEPSRYFEELFECIRGQSSDKYFSTIERQITTQALVSSLRRETLQSSNDEDLRFAATLLKTLEGSGIASADSDRWLGAMALSSDQPVASSDDLVYISPSGLAAFSDCGLKWFLEKSGAKDADSAAQLLGVSIHFIAAQVFTNPDLTFEEAKEQLTGAWPVVDQNVGWFKAEQLTEALRMLQRFFEWNEANDQRRTLVAVEENFEVAFGRAVLRGSVDRLEQDLATGGYFVVDLKTGSTVTKAEAAENQQLSAYQLGVLAGGFEDLPQGVAVDGAGLLFLSKSTDKNKTIDQAPIDPALVEAEIRQAADQMTAATFEAIINKRCRTCQVRAMCPLQSEGRSVLEP
jgi:superfamily I DNA/RNA helicase/RecB family exonuclease